MRIPFYQYCHDKPTYKDWNSKTSKKKKKKKKEQISLSLFTKTVMKNQLKRNGKKNPKKKKKKKKKELISLSLRRQSPWDAVQEPFLIQLLWFVRSVQMVHFRLTKMHKCVRRVKGVWVGTT